MHFFFSGPRFMGIRPGVILSPSDFFRRPSVSAAPIEGSFLYVIKGAPDLVKIGVTTDPRGRINQLQTASPYPLEFVAISATPGTGYDIEDMAHRTLSAYRASGEWFRVHPMLAIEAINVAAQTCRQPLLRVSVDEADRILAIARSLPQELPPRSRTVGYIFVTLLMILGVLAGLSGIGEATLRQQRPTQDIPL